MRSPISTCSTPEPESVRKSRRLRRAVVLAGMAMFLSAPVAMALPVGFEVDILSVRREISSQVTIMIYDTSPPTPMVFEDEIVSVESGAFDYEIHVWDADAAQNSLVITEQISGTASLFAPTDFTAGDGDGTRNELTVVFRAPSMLRYGLVGHFFKPGLGPATEEAYISLTSPTEELIRVRPGEDDTPFSEFVTLQPGVDYTLTALLADSHARAGSTVYTFYDFEVVPEPGTALLLGFGLSMLSQRRDRRREKSMPQRAAQGTSPGVRVSAWSGRG